ncbi:hypothetical protein DND132_0155 [Pseudodesulfovibrio mercurii]|uniref:Uncharacterized protein n=1 Tax=Pseudodesulfovibrio mercurii TaxID=641491 RepID=F0JDK4_9BACT|nr:hypothetical protein [Pseudodesulfovibrio mercurii]EGB13373.1 hypothetical protein DND132_0155 [Pseudodesulfovibrio mercurii]
MRRFIILTLTLCMLGFTASAWAGPGNNGRDNHGQAVRQFNQQSRQGNQSFHNQGNQSYHNQGNQGVRQSAPGMSGQRFMQPGHNVRHQQANSPRHHQEHRFQGRHFQGQRPREVRREVHTGHRNVTTSSVQGSYLSIGGGQMLSLQILATD